MTLKRRCVQRAHLSSLPKFLICECRSPQQPEVPSQCRFAVPGRVQMCWLGLRRSFWHRLMGDQGISWNLSKKTGRVFGHMSWFRVKLWLKEVIGKNIESSGSLGHFISGSPNHVFSYLNTAARSGGCCQRQGEEARREGSTPHHVERTPEGTVLSVDQELWKR